MLINFISGKSLIIATLLVSSGFGTVTTTHVKSSDVRPKTVVAKVGLAADSKTTNATSTSHGKSTSPTTSTSGQVNSGMPVGAKLHGLCVAYRADLMMGGGVTANVQTHLAGSTAFRSLSKLATSKGETIAVLCATQGGVSMTALPAGTANVKVPQSTIVSGASQSGALSLVTGNRP
jgi:hypothetical protein